MIHHTLESAKRIFLSQKINKNKLDTFFLPSILANHRTNRFHIFHKKNQRRTSSSRSPNLRHQFFNFSLPPLASPSSNAMNYSHTWPRRENFFLFSPSRANTHTLSLSLSIFQKKSATLKVPFRRESARKWQD